ncbi:MAG: MlaA family lipoprotein [Rhodospirillales bacterium]
MSAGAAHAAPIYDMGAMMGSPNPMAVSPPAPAPAPARGAPAPFLAPALPEAGTVSGTQLYDMSIFLNGGGGAFPAPAGAAGFDESFGADDFGGDYGAVSDTPVEDSGDENDPLEPFNRMVFQFNQLVYDIVMDPAAYAYTSVMPDAAMNAVDNAMKNLGEPVTLANDLLQMEFERAWNTTKRTTVNSTVGVGGLFNVSDEFGIPFHSEDFGQTLAVYGAPEPFYLMLPVYGPSNPRDASKLFVHKYMDGYGYLIGKYGNEATGVGLQVLGGVNSYRKVQKDLETMRETSIDYYAALRSLYRQNRAGEIANSDGVYVPDDLDYDLGEDF